MKRTIIVSVMGIVGLVGIASLFGVAVKLACILMVIENSLIVYGYYLSVREDEIPRRELFNILNASTRHASILELNISMINRQKVLLEKENIRLHKELIDAQDRERAVASTTGVS